MISFLIIVYTPMAEHPKDIHHARNILQNRTVGDLPCHSRPETHAQTQARQEATDGAGAGELEEIVVLDTAAERYLIETGAPECGSRDIHLNLLFHCVNPATLITPKLHFRTCLDN